MAHTRFDWDPDKDAENQGKQGFPSPAPNMPLPTHGV
jgi:hypothetical protein